MRVLDVSWNDLKFNIKELKSFFENNKVLMHFDMSYCRIEEIGTTDLIKSVARNQTIYGLHY